MTEPQTTTAATAVPGSRYGRRRRPFGEHIAESVSRLQGQYLAGVPAAAATLARLRAAAGTVAGSRFDVLGATAVPGRFLPRPPSDEPEPAEHAAHAVLTLYAVHQQSDRARRRHRDGHGFGHAVGLLARQSTSPEAVRRRFTALGTASTFTEAVHHARGLVRLMRDKDIGFDYGLLADDLLAFQAPGGPDRVRGWWGREYYRADAAPPPGEQTGTGHIEEHE